MRISKHAHLSIAGIAVFATVALLLFGACQMDYGLEPIRSSISGTVVFDGAWPDSVLTTVHTERVDLIIARKFPPTELADLIFGPQIPVGTDTFQYQVFVSPGVYEAVGLIWKGLDRPYSLADVIGMYTAGSDSTPTPIRVSEKTSAVKNVDITASFAQFFKTGAISGRITYVGGWPQEIGLTAIAVLKTKPPTFDFSSILRNLVEFDTLAVGGVGQGPASQDYVLPIAPGHYGWVVVVYNQRNASLLNMKDIGTYYIDPSDTTAPTPIDVPSADTLRNIDITADFGRLP